MNSSGVLEIKGPTPRRVNACRLQIAPCNGCGGCERTGRCVIEDEMQRIYNQIDDADIIVLASPIYFYNVTAQCKALIDRCQALWSRKYVLRKRSPMKGGFFLSTGGTKGKKMFDGAILTVRYFFDAINATYSGHLLFEEIDQKGEIRTHPTALKDAYQTGAKLAVGTPCRVERKRVSAIQMGSQASPHESR